MAPKVKYIPTLEEIAQGTAKIRKRWSEKTHRKRAGLEPKPEPYTIPIYHVSATRVDGLVMDQVG